MSLKVMSRVWSDYPGAGEEMLLALAIADRADDTGRCPPTLISELAVAIKSDSNGVNMILGKMVCRGWLDEADLTDVDEEDMDPQIAWQINQQWINAGTL